MKFNLKAINLSKIKHFNILMVVTLTLIVIGLTTSITLAYLESTLKSKNDNTATGGNPHVSLYQKTNTTYTRLSTNEEIESENEKGKISHTFTVSTVGELNTLDLYIKNDGDINALVMLTVAISYGQNNSVLTTTNATFQNTGWVNVSSYNIDYATSGVYNNTNHSAPQTRAMMFNSLYNSVLAPTPSTYTSIGGITLNSLPNGTTAPLDLKITIGITSIAHSGNPYLRNENDTQLKERFENSYGQKFSTSFLENTWTAWK